MPNEQNDEVFQIQLEEKKAVKEYLTGLIEVSELKERTEVKKANLTVKEIQVRTTA